jgi:hypothetical protein
MTTEPIPPQSGEDVATPTEQVHIPGPSYLPVWTAFGITLLLVGLVLSWGLTAAGGVIAIIAIVRWIKESRADINDLPLEH